MNLAPVVARNNVEEERREDLRNAVVGPNYSFLERNPGSTTTEEEW